MEYLNTRFPLLTLFFAGYKVSIKKILQRKNNRYFKKNYNNCYMYVAIVNILNKTNKSEIENKIWWCCIYSSIPKISMKEPGFYVTGSLFSFKRVFKYFFMLIKKYIVDNSKLWTDSTFFLYYKTKLRNDCFITSVASII